jgi:hypothetical protein
MITDYNSDLFPTFPRNLFNAETWEPMTDEEVEQYRAATAHLEATVSALPNPSVGDFDRNISYDGQDGEDADDDDAADDDDIVEEGTDVVVDESDGATSLTYQHGTPKDTAVVEQRVKTGGYLSGSRARAILKCVASVAWVVLFPDAFRIVV